MILQHFMQQVGPHEANTYLLADEDTHAAVLIDAGHLHPDLVDLARRRHLRVTHILLTHLHFDHIDGLPLYLEQWPEARVVAPAAPPAAPRALLVAEGDCVECPPFTFEVFKTSGHTPESISYYLRDRDLCFVGDCIFAGSVGGTASDELFAEQLGHLRRTILTLPPHTELYSGHGPMTTVGIELAANPFLQPGFGRSA